MSVNQKYTIADIQKLKKIKKLFSVITAYDFPTAKIINKLDFPIILVGDSASMVVYGHNNTTQIGMDEMILLAQAVSKGASRSLIVGDMPFMSYQPSIETAIKNAGRFITEGQVNAVKLEGGIEYVEQITAIISAGIPVMGHIGLKPQSVLIESGYKIHGKTHQTALKIYNDAIALEKAGVFALVLEAIPQELAALITQAVKVPTIGIGAGPFCNAQIQVLHDILGLLGNAVPKHAKMYINLEELITTTLMKYKNDIENMEFPNKAHSFIMDPIELKKLKKALENL